MKVQYYIKTQLDECSEVDKNSDVDRNSVKLVDESSVVVQNTDLKLEGLDEKAVVDQRVFPHPTNCKTTKQIMGRIWFLNFQLSNSHYCLISIL